MKNLSLRIAILCASLGQMELGAAAAASDLGESSHSSKPPSRMFAACEQYLAPPLAMLFKISRGGRTAHVIGTMDPAGGPAERLPDFARAVIAKTKLLLEFELLDVAEGVRLVEAEEMASKEMDWKAVLGDQHGAFIHFMQLLGLSESDTETMGPFTTNSVLLTVMQLMSAQLGPEEMHQVNLINSAFQSLEPAPDEHEQIEFMNELSLTKGVSRLATQNGARFEYLKVNGVSVDEVRAQLQSPDSTQELVAGLLKLEKISRMGKIMRTDNWEFMNEDADRVAKLFPTQTLQNRMIHRQIASLIETAMEQNDGVLANLHQGLMIGSHGVVQALRGMGFVVERVEN